VKRSIFGAIGEVAGTGPEVPPEFPTIPSDAADWSARQREGNAATGIADDFLAAVSAGEDRAAELAIALANAVLDASGAKLAQGVLEGGPLSITRAIRLAEVVLSAAAPGVGCRAGAAS
jgi:hypothetical protein